MQLSNHVRIFLIIIKKLIDESRINIVLITGLAVIFSHHQVCVKHINTYVMM
jgi:hypothetical protein